MILSKIRGIWAVVQFSITVFFLIGLMYLFNKNNHYFRKLWAKVQMFMLGVKFDIKGELDESADLILLNHQSLLDITVMEYLHSRDIAWVAKKEISDIPIFGHIMKAPHMISIDRENKAGLIRLLSETKDRISKGRPIAIFPEGTRSDGKSMGDFKAGAKMVALKHKLKVQPVVLLHTRERIDSQNLTAEPGTVIVRYLPSFSPEKSDKEWYSKLEADMKEVFYKELEKEKTE